jgi:hypothetical protein
MKTQTDKYCYKYDPQMRFLFIEKNGKLVGTTSGKSAERNFIKAQESGAEITITTMGSDALIRAKVKRLRGLWITQGIDQHRDAILATYGLTSTADLNNEQLDELIARFTHANHPPTSDAVRKQRHEALATLTRLGIYTTPGDWGAVNDYLMDERIAGKLMYQLTEQELTMLNRKLHSILRKKATSTVINANYN